MTSSTSSFLVDNNQESPNLLKYLHNIIQILNNDRLNGNDSDKAYIKSLIQRAELTILNNINNNDHTLKTVGRATTPANQVQQLSFSRQNSGAIKNNVQL